MTTGRLYQIRFNNPYRTPPDDLPRVLAEMYVLSEDCAGGRLPPEIAGYPCPPGYSVHITHIGEPIVSRPPDVRARIRRQRLAARNARKAPLFAEIFTEEEIAHKPHYYIDGVSDSDAAYNAALAVEEAVYQRLLTEHGHLIIYADPSESSDPSKGAMPS